MSSETLQKNHQIQISYEDLPPQQRLFEIDQELLDKTLTKLGFPEKAKHPVVIRRGNRPEDQLEMAKFDWHSQTAQLNQEVIAAGLKAIYKDLLGNSGLAPSGELKVKLLNKILSSKLFSYLYIPNWPYLLIKNGPKRSFFPGKQEKITSYIERAKKHELYPGLTPQEQDEKIRRSLNNLTRMYAERSVAWILAHELEHGNKFWAKMALNSLSIVAPIAIGTAILSMFGESISQPIKNTTALAILASPIFTTTLSQSHIEQKSYNAGDQYFADLTKAIKINPEVFNQAVLGQEVS